MRELATDSEYEQLRCDIIEVAIISKVADGCCKIEPEKPTNL